MKTYKNIYPLIISEENLYLAYRKARKGKTKKEYVKEFENSLKENITQLRLDLLFHSYQPEPLETFIIRDPKTRKISKSHFQDRVVHHALCNIIEPLFEKSFIYDSYANRKGKGTLSALMRFDQFKRKVSRNGKVNGWFTKNNVGGFVLKADIKHYFETVDHGILLGILKRKIKCSRTIWLIKKIISNYHSNSNKGMPLGNLTSQFFANVYLNELDQFVKHQLGIKYYIRYVDDFIILCSSKEKLNRWKKEINIFLRETLKVELHPDKSRIISLGRATPFIGFRVFYHYRLLKKFNRKNIQRRLDTFRCLFLEKKIDYDKIYESMQGSFAYMKHANTYWFREKLVQRTEKYFPSQIASAEVNKYLKCLNNYFFKDIMNKYPQQSPLPRAD